MQVQVSVTLEEAYFGTSRRLRILRPTQLSMLSMLSRSPEISRDLQRCPDMSRRCTCHLPGLSLAAVVRAKVHQSFVLLARHESVVLLGAVELCEEYDSNDSTIFNLCSRWALLDHLF